MFFYLFFSFGKHSFQVQETLHNIVEINLSQNNLTTSI